MIDGTSSYLTVCSPPPPKCADVIDMPVPSSYNDITQDKNIRDHIGWVWYQRKAFVPKRWKSSRVNIRVGSANYYAGFVLRKRLSSSVQCSLFLEWFSLLVV